MTNFQPRLVPSPYDFYINRDRHGHWVVRERRNLAGGVFLSRDGARRFALSEVGGDATRIHRVPSRQRARV